MLIPLLLLGSSALTSSPVSTSTAGNDPPVRVWFNSSGDYGYGDRAKVYAKSDESGYLVVLRADGDGKVRVLFPLDPKNDQQITGDKKYELKGRGGREAFIADDTREHGTVLAAFSKTPFRVEAFAKDGHWDFQALSDKQVRDDPESGLLDLVHRMKPAGDHFDFAVATYVVSDQFTRRSYPDPYYWGYDPWWGYGPRFGLGLSYRPWHFRRGWGWGPW
jgi:hypothetical protein